MYILKCQSNANVRKCLNIAGYCAIPKSNTKVNLPGVPLRAGWAPGKVKTPPFLRYFAAKLEAMTDVQTLCFHMLSALSMISDMTDAWLQFATTLLLLIIHSINKTLLFSTEDWNLIKQTWCILKCTVMECQH